MHPEDLIVVTGAAGFIGSYLTGLLNEKGFRNLVLVDEFDRADKSPNLQGKAFGLRLGRYEFFDWLDAQGSAVKAVFHLGARTDTTEMDESVHRKWNLEYSQQVWQLCTRHSIPLLYASSAATYGDGALGYSDDHEIVSRLQPLNPYGRSKNDFDIWALAQATTPPFWAGVKFFNVYGPNEYHKGRMASVILHAFRQIRDAGSVKLFRSHRPDFSDGGQLRDFVYVADVAAMCFWLIDHQPASGLYNIGTGRAESFNALATAVFDALGLAPQIHYIDTPEDIRDKYQYFTEADMRKLREAGYAAPIRPLQEGVADYVRRFLAEGKYF